MPNEIPVRQNQPQFIDKLAAASWSYNRAKLIAALLGVIAIVVAIAGIVINNVLPEYRSNVAFGIMLTVLVSHWLGETACDLRKKGAQFQESFDVGLFDLGWNQACAGKPPEAEAISASARKFLEKRQQAELENWYSAGVADVPLELARFICQRSSMSWDASLRRQYAAILMAIILLTLLGSLGFAHYRDWTVSEWVMVFAIPFAPLWITLYGERTGHVKSAIASDESKSLLIPVWASALQGGPSTLLADHARTLQNRLFEVRKSSPTVPNFVYRFYRQGYEQDMEYAVRDMISQAKAAAVS
jgi:hypothetical protein